MKSKTIITLMLIIDNALEKLINQKLSDKEEKKQIFLYNFITGQTLPMIIYHCRKMKFDYDWLFVEHNIPLYLVELFRESEKDSKRIVEYSYKNYEGRNLYKEYR